MSTVKLKHTNGVLVPVRPRSLPLAEGEVIEVQLPASFPTEPPTLTEKESAAAARRQRLAARKFRGVVRGGPADWSEGHDEVLYGKP